MTGTARSLAPLAGAWKQAFHLATNGSGSYSKGLNLARNGAVAQIHTQPGRISAPVAAKKATHHAAIHLPELTATQWDTLAARLADDRQAVADLVANRIPATIADSGHAGGISIARPPTASPSPAPAPPAEPTASATTAQLSATPSRNASPSPPPCCSAPAA